MAPQRHDLIVVGASAGGVEALRGMVAGMPSDLRAAVAVVLHLPSGGTSALSQILRRSGKLPAISAADGMPVRPGTVYAAPPDHQLLVIEDQFALSHGPTENGHRPAINALFRSAAVSMGPRVIGVLLSGVLDDGVAGLLAIKARGGLVIVQDPADAMYPAMPQNAIRTVQADHVLPVAEIGPLLAKLTTEGHHQADGLERFQCRVEHARSAEALLQAQGDGIEQALWMAVRALDEKANTADRMCQHAERAGNARSVEHYTSMADETRGAADVLRNRLTTIPLQTVREAGDEN